MTESDRQRLFGELALSTDTVLSDDEIVTAWEEYRGDRGKLRALYHELMAERVEAAVTQAGLRAQQRGKIGG